MERIKALFEAIGTYLREVLGELRKVIWPTPGRTLRLTGIVLGMVAIISGFLFVLDLALGAGMNALLGR